MYVLVLIAVIVACVDSVSYVRQVLRLEKQLQRTGQISEQEVGDG
jgi:heme exporter protein D